MSRHEVGVQVRLKNVADLQTVFLCCFKINLHIALWIDYDALALRSEQVRCMCQTAEIELFKVHRMASIRCEPNKNVLWRRYCGTATKSISSRFQLPKLL